MTVSYNSDKTIERTIKSVLLQNYHSIEYIVIDGGSNDRTLDILNKYNINYITEKDEGIYDAMNKGILKCTGDIIGILNSDDYYANNFVVQNIVSHFSSINEKIGIIYSDLIFKENNKIKRIYNSRNFKLKHFKIGLMPPHPTVFIKKELYNNFGLYRTDYKIASDFDFLFKLMYINKIKYSYMPGVTVIMSLGGVSTKNLKNKLLLNKEISNSLKTYNINLNIFGLIIKYIFRLKEIFLLGRSTYEK